jgi:hypothetical protein
MKIPRASVCASIGLMSLLVNCAAAQYQPGAYAPPQNYPVFPSGGGGGGGWGWGGGYGGTAAGSYLHGMGDVIRSAGYANVMNSLAAQNYQAAYSMSLNNRLLATNTYFENRRANRAARAEEAGPRPTAEDLARISEQMAPKRLTASQLDPVSGDVKWPSVLEDPRYAALRGTVDKLFTQRQAASGGASEYRAIVDAVEALRQAMRKNIDEYAPASYIDASKFLDSLQYEARFLAG